jgi:hypothetical protein
MSKTQQNKIKLNENNHFFDGTDDDTNNEIEPFTILDYEFFSSENVTLVGRGDNLVSFNGDRFSQGQGGVMNIDLTMNSTKPVISYPK